MPRAGNWRHVDRGVVMKRRCIACLMARAEYPCDCHTQVLRPAAVTPHWLGLLLVVGAVWLGAHVVSNVTGWLSTLDGAAPPPAIDSPAR
jgi:hypothetical protein